MRYCQVNVGTFFHTESFHAGPAYRCSGRPLPLNPRSQRHITLACRFRSGSGSAGARNVPFAADMHAAGWLNAARIFTILFLSLLRIPFGCTLSVNTETFLLQVLNQPLRSYWLCRERLSPRKCRMYEIKMDCIDGTISGPRTDTGDFEREYARLSL